MHVQSSNRLVQLIQTMLPPTLPKVDDASVERRTPKTARAYAFITLGKLCLRDESLAKECLNLLARELHQNIENSSPSIQSNALLVMGDLCVKYTNLVDKYVPVMAMCLQSGESSSENFNLDMTTCTYATIPGVPGSSSSMVRKHAILLLSSLILQDYIKWRGLLVHRFLVAYVDDDESVSKLAEMTLCGPLLSRQRNLFFNNFVESLFVLNRCTAHPIYAAAEANGDNGAGLAVGFEGINLSGMYGRMKRLNIYRMMLNHMTDEEKIGITARLAKVVLGGALESDGDLSMACRQSPPGMFSPSEARKSQQQRRECAISVLSDAFAVLTSKEAKVGRTSGGEEGDVEDNTTDANGTAQFTAVKGKLLSKISRKHLIETILPILCNLKSILEANRSPLLKDLMRYLVDIFRSYRKEAREVLASDPTVLQEIEYDTRQFEKQRRQKRANRASRLSKGSSMGSERISLTSKVGNTPTDQNKS
uniref:Condensin complex subunit 1 C-terminal domain-containing protein n=1 Tax=Ditylum brightwellii TaxID=49249 RepID=A0A7S4T9Y0_9STRA